MDSRKLRIVLCPQQLREEFHIFSSATARSALKRNQRRPSCFQKNTSIGGLYSDYSIIAFLARALFVKIYKKNRTSIFTEKFIFLVQFLSLFNTVDNFQSMFNFYGIRFGLYGLTINRFFHEKTSRWPWFWVGAKGCIRFRFGRKSKSILLSVLKIYCPLSWSQNWSRWKSFLLWICL